MPDKKFKLSKKQGLYAVAGVALVGSLAAAAITSPEMLHSIFDPDKYSFNDTRINGSVAYNTTEGVGNGSSDDDSNMNSNAPSDAQNNSEEHEDQAWSDGPEQVEDKKRPQEEQHKEPEDAKRNNSNNDRGTSNEPSEESGVDDGGYSKMNTGLSTDAASSKDSDGDDLGADSDIMVDLKEDDGTIDSVIPEYTEAPVVTSAPSATKEPEKPVTTREPEIPAQTQRPVSTTVPRATQNPIFDSSFTPSTSSSSGDTSSPVPSVTAPPVATEAPVVTEVPVATEEPVVTEVPVATREPMPTEAPEPQKPSDIVKDNEEAGNVVQVSKGEIGITNHTGGGGSVTSGGATRIDFTKFTGDQSGVEYIQVSSTIKNIDFETAKVLFPNLKGFVVNEKNKYFKSIDGVLYSKDGKTLYACPAQVTEITEFPEELETIHDGAFLGSSIANLTIPETVKEIGENAFAEASIGTLTFKSDSVNLGATAFFNSEDDGLSVKKLVFTGTTPPSVDDNSALKFKNPHTGLDTSGMIIEVPDSGNDSVLCEYMKAWGETIDGLYGSGMTSYLFNTPEGAAERYSYENKSLYRKLLDTSEDDNGGTVEDAAKYSGYELLYVAPSTEGEFTPAYDTRAIAADAFTGCDKITSINILSTVETLEDGCFKGLDNLTSIVVSGTVPAQIGESVWKDINPDEVKIYVYPDALESYLGSWGKALDEIFGEGSGEKIINGVAESYTYIDGALYSITEDGKILVDAPHTNLDNFALAEGTIKIEEGAFGSKYTYNYVLIPNTVTEISENAFASASIEVLVMTSQTPATLSDAVKTAGIKKVYVPSASLEAYKEAWGDVVADIEAPSLNYVADNHAIYGVDVDDRYTLFNLPVTFKGTFTMLDTVKEIRERAVYGTGVETINFSVTTEKLGKESFAENTSLKSVDMVALTSLAEIPEMTFYNCNSMTDMQLPLLVTKIGDSMAENCTSLLTVNFSKLSKLEEIGDRAFYNNTSLEQVSLSSSRSLVKVGESVFENCSSIQTVRMPLNLEKMSDKMFKNASSLGRIAFASNLKEIGDEALYGTALETMNISSLKELETIGEGAFAENKALKEITLPEKVTKVSNRLAENDTALTKVTMSENTTEIGEAAFRGCSILEDIIIPAAVEKIGKDAFAGCDSLKSIKIESETPAEVGENAFGDALDGMKIYVPKNTFAAYVEAWNKVLYNRAAEVIVEEAEATEEPGTSPEPGATDEPTTTPEPGVTDEPTTTPEPGMTDEPTATDEPEATEEPSVTEEPSATDEPSTTEEPTATEEPAQTAEPTVTAEPENSEEPESTPDNTEQETEPSTDTEDSTSDNVSDAGSDVDLESSNAPAESVTEETVALKEEVISVPDVEFEVE